MSFISFPFTAPYSHASMPVENVMREAEKPKSLQNCLAHVAPIFEHTFAAHPILCGVLSISKMGYG